MEELRINKKVAKVLGVSDQNGNLEFEVSNVEYYESVEQINERLDATFLNIHFINNDEEEDLKIMLSYNDALCGGHFLKIKSTYCVENEEN